MYSVLNPRFIPPIIKLYLNIGRQKNPRSLTSMRLFNKLTREFNAMRDSWPFTQPFRNIRSGFDIPYRASRAFFSFFPTSNGTLARAFPHCIHFSSPKPIIFPLIRHGLIDIQANDLYTYHPVVLPTRNQNLLDICIPYLCIPPRYDSSTPCTVE